MIKTWAIAIKELKQISRDPLSLLMLVGLPTLLLILFGYALSFDVENVALAVQDRDGGEASRRLVDSFVNSRRFRIVEWPRPETDLQRIVEEGRATAVLVVPERFSARLRDGETAPIQLLVDGTDANTATTVLGFANALVQDFNGALVGRALRASGDGDLLEAAISVQPRIWYNPELVSSRFLVPGLIAFILMFTSVLSTALSLVREKERGTLEQLRVAPVRTPQILLGKMLPYLLVAVVAVVLILAAARILFDVEVRGSYAALASSTLLFLVGGLGWGLFVSTLAESQAVAFQIGTLSALLPTMLLSGFVFPIRIMPEPLQLITRIVPARYYLVVLRGVVLKGADLTPYWDQIGWLAGYTIVVMALATLRFSRQRG